jgi:hypothetical protein
MNAKEAIMKIRALFEEASNIQEAQVEEAKQEFAEYQLADGTKVMISSLEIGGEIKLEDGSFAPDGDHQLADGSQISVLGGKITEIEAAEKPEADMPEVEVEAKKDKKMEEMAAEFAAKISEMNGLIEALNEKISSIEDKSKQGFSQVVDLIEEVTKMPQADPIEKPQSFKFEATKDIKFERLNKYRHAILNSKN